MTDMASQLSLSVVKEAFNDIEHEALAWLVAGTIQLKSSEKPVRLLVLSREGNTAARLLNTAKKILRKNGPAPHVDVEEVSVADLFVLNKGAIEMKKPDDRPVAGKKFDAIVGFEVAEHATPEEMPGFIHWVSNHLESDGVFLHGQVWAPDVRFWLKNTRILKDSKMTAGKFLLNENEEHGKTMRTAVQTAHHELLDCIRRTAIRQKLLYGEFQQNAQVEKNAHSSSAMSALDAAGFNSIQVMHGYVDFGRDKNVLKGFARKKLTVQIAMVSNKTPPKEFEAQMRAHGFVR